MESQQVLEIVERLHNTAEHPDIVQVERYGRDVKPGGQSPAGVAITYRSGSQAYIWAAAGKPEPVQADWPEEMPERKARALHALKFLVELLEVAQPEAFTAWRTVAFTGTEMKPGGLAVRCADGSTVYLRATSGYGGFAALDTEEFPDYIIPESVKASA